MSQSSSSKTSLRVAFFTAGTHGAGHLVRGLAVHRALRRAAPSTTFRLFAPASPFSRIAAGVLEEVVVDPATLRDPRRAPDSALGQALARFAPDVVVVDLFWVPLFFVPISCPVWLLLRSVPPVWLVGPQESRFDAARYQRIFAIEPAPGLLRFEPLDPIVIADPADVPSSSSFSGQRLIVRAGLPADQRVLEEAARQRHPGPWTTLDLADPAAPFPAAPHVTTAADVVAAPGYNTFWEARWLGFARRTTFVPIRRALDDAAWRAALPLDVVPRHNGAHTLAQALLAGG